MTNSSSDLDQLRSSAKKLLERTAPVNAFRALRDGGSLLGRDPAFWATMAKSGWLAVAIDEEQGGIGLGFEAGALLCEEMGRTLAASPFIPAAIMAPVALRDTVPAAQEEWLARIAGGLVIIAIAIDEGRKHDPATLATRAVSADGRWQLTGRKTYVAEGYGADSFVLSAITEQGKLALFLIDAQSPGIVNKRLVTLDGRNACSVVLDQCLVPEKALIAAGEEAQRILDMTLDVGRICAAAELIGIAGEVLDRTLAYARQRKQFGRHIGSFQAIQHRLAHLHCEIEVARSSVQAAARAADADLASAGALAALAKAKAEQAAHLATTEGIQLHGGIGMTEELDLGLFLKRMRVLGELWGDYWFHADRFASFRGY